MLADDYDPDYFDDTVLGNGVKRLLPTFLNYFSRGSDKADGTAKDYIVYGTYISDGTRGKGGVADLTSALSADPHLKIMALHGYYDMATPFFTTETQLQLAGLDKVIPVHVFASGHMNYYVEAARPLFKKVFDEFYARVPATAATN
ncbi:hypothetical protein [Phyllobacterium zundukense]|uniref:Uncharacterized protein n=1 Tax=Phyllobacterium zundukense TaxID=1867719 RepID=A0ACD4D3U9_9HYPH|nr:hypothetical protein [Phyllobacterium zundukense]UXN60463.1 hypothetical protein N8E88_28895 [Phyllobacterium zundukense]